jgi:hypothetical protein
MVLTPSPATRFPARLPLDHRPLREVPDAFGETGLGLNLVADMPHGVEARLIVRSAKSSLRTSRFNKTGPLLRRSWHNRRILRNPILTSKVV